MANPLKLDDFSYVGKKEVDITRLRGQMASFLECYDVDGFNLAVETSPVGVAHIDIYARRPAGMINSIEGRSNAPKEGLLRRFGKNDLVIELGFHSGPNFYFNLEPIDPRESE